MGLDAAILSVTGNVGKHVYEAEASFAHPLGFGGKVDLHSKSTENGIVLDFKTKNTSDVKKMKGYSEHIMQLAAYREGLGIPNARCYNLFISTQNPELVVLQEYKEDDLKRHWQMFLCLLRYWRLSNKFGEN